jgi:hypothetical protein
MAMDMSPSQNEEEDWFTIFLLALGDDDSPVNKPERYWVQEGP